MGGRRSLEILETLDHSRFGAVAAARASRTAGELQWRPAQSGAIQREVQRTTWHSGHVEAVLSDGQAVIAGSHSGGVWLINPIPSPSFRDGYRATPLSDPWETPNVRSLAYGPDGTQHVFVGCVQADSLFLIEFQAVTGAVVVKRADLAIPLPSRGTVRTIVVLESPRRLVIATSFGLLWSDIPVPATAVESYVWQTAAGLPAGPCVSIARGPGTSIAAAVSAAPARLHSLDPPEVADRLFAGDWDEETLRFEPATVPEVAQAAVFEFVLASSLHAPERMYGVATNNEAVIACVLRSDDGGRNWSAATIPVGAGEQGFYNRALAVSPYRPDVVALGWQAAGPFLSTDGAASWTHLSGGDGTDANGQPCPGSARGLHSDIHDLYFPLNPSEADHLIIASDGGIAVTRDLGRCFDSQYNRGLHTLQFYGGEHKLSPPTLSVSSRFHGLLSGGTQDNGNLTLHPDKDAGAVWHRLVGGDGGLTRFVDPLGALLHESNGERRVRLTTWNAAERVFSGPGAVVMQEGTEEGVIAKAIESVAAPNWGRDGRLLYACAGTTGGEVFGLFANADGGNAAFRLIASVGSSVTAVASQFGAEILVACSDGRNLVVDSATGTWSEQPSDPAFGAIIRFEILSRDLVYGLRRGELWRFDGQRWTPLPAAGQPWLIFTADRETGRLFAATDADVFSSSDGGRTWSDASAGLPARPHCTDLRIGSDADGGSTLYLTTYGRSVWRAKITFAPDKGPNFDLPPQAREIIFGVIQDGGGVVRVGGRLVRIGPRQPVTDLLAALAINEIAEGMSEDAAREIRRTSLQQMARVIGRALERLG